MSECLSEWLSEWVTEWVTEWLSEWLSEWVMIEGVSVWMSKWLSEWLCYIWYILPIWCMMMRFRHLTLPFICTVIQLSTASTWHLDIPAKISWKRNWNINIHETVKIKVVFTNLILFGVSLWDQKHIDDVWNQNFKCQILKINWTLKVISMYSI